MSVDDQATGGGTGSYLPGMVAVARQRPRVNRPVGE
jgi:hypothetical protein